MPVSACYSILEPTPLINTIINGYLILGKLGEGAYGEIFKARKISNFIELI